DWQLDQALYDAIRFDSVYFADLLVEHGASFDNLEGIISMKELYENHVRIRGMYKRLPCGRGKENPSQDDYYRDYFPDTMVYNNGCY
ncbi:unnamed protein product, partial [Didymodactylos carnosus]